MADTDWWAVCDTSGWNHCCFACPVWPCPVLPCPTLPCFVLLGAALLGPVWCTLLLAVPCPPGKLQPC